MWFRRKTCRVFNKTVYLSEDMGRPEGHVSLSKRQLDIRTCIFIDPSLSSLDNCLRHQTSVMAKFVEEIRTSRSME